MIRVERTEEPEGFDERCRKRGMQWLQGHPPAADGSEERPHPYWLEFLPELRAAFQQRCAYLGLYIATGTVDHFRAWRGSGGRALAYEWSNYRYADHTVNSAKKPAWDGRLLDPFEIDEAWFEVILPSCELRLVQEKIPPEILPRARFTVEKLGLDHREDIVELRREWLRMHEEEGLSLAELHRRAPLVARAVERRAADHLPGVAVTLDRT